MNRRLLIQSAVSAAIVLALAACDKAPPPAPKGKFRCAGVTIQTG